MTTEEDYNFEVIGISRGLGDLDSHTPPWENRAVIQHHKVSEIHWSERKALGYSAEPREPWEYGDNNKSDPEQNWEEE